MDDIESYTDLNISVLSDVVEDIEGYIDDRNENEIEETESDINIIQDSEIVNSEEQVTHEKKGPVQSNKIETVRSTRLPLARIKNIMKMDPDVSIVNAEAVFLVTKATDSMSELRELCYPGTDVLMLCFSVVRPETFRSVAERWTRAVAGVNAPLVLVGTQSDLALDGRVLQTLRSRGEHPVTELEARALAAKINATYVETSAKTRKQLKDAFDAAILAGLPVIQSKRSLWKKLLCLH